MLSLTNLRKSYGSCVAVDGVTLRAEKGKVFGLLGPNGAGKSTTIAMTVGLLAPDSGTVDIEGAGSPTSPDARRLLGVAPQALAIYEDLTGVENLRFFAKLQGIPNVKQAAERALATVGLESKGGERAGKYSGGMKRRLNLAAALIHDPQVLLLDEPTAGVDPQSRNNILDTVRGLAASGRTVIYTTHYMEEAAKLCDRVAIMDKGKLLAEGTVSELISAHGGRSVLTLTRGGQEFRQEVSDPLPEVSRSLASGDVTALRIDRPDLESVFLNLTGRRLRD
ncbi:MAG: ABC transporter ATP-binding protein [Phycisphaerales bacterium]